MGLEKIKMKVALLKNINSSSSGKILKVGVNDQQCSAGGSSSMGIKSHKFSPSLCHSIIAHKIFVKLFCTLHSTIVSE